MAILDWLKEIPLSAIYKERLAESEKQISALQAENIELKARLSQCEEHGRTLEQQIVNMERQQSEKSSEFTHFDPPNLDF